MPAQRQSPSSPGESDEEQGSSPQEEPDKEHSVLLQGASDRAADDHDSPWKEALEHFFPQAIALLAPDLHALIDWSVTPKFLDKELQALGIPDGPHGKGRLLADKLVQVRLLDRPGVGVNAWASSGRDLVAWILIHIEVQGGRISVRTIGWFTHRMYRYRTRFEDRHEQLNVESGQPPPLLFSLGILVRSKGGPSHLEYHSEFLGQGVRFSFPVVHLSQWLDRWDELESIARTNPFAVVIMAQLRAVQYRDHALRIKPAIALIRLLFSYGYPRDKVQRLLRLTEWMLRLPKELEPTYLAALQHLEQEQKMSYVTIAERLGTQKGLEQGLQQGLKQGLTQGREEGQALLLLRLVQRRFGAASDEIVNRISRANSQQLETWSLNFVDAKTLDEVFLD